MLGKNGGNLTLLEPMGIEISKILESTFTLIKTSMGQNRFWLLRNRDYRVMDLRRLD